MHTLKTLTLIFTFALYAGAQDFDKFYGELNDVKSAASSPVAVPVVEPAPVVEVAEVEAPAEIPEWLVMVFINGRNNLYSAAIKDVNEMEMVGSTAKIAVTVELGLVQDEGNSTRYFIQKDTRFPVANTVRGDGDYNHIISNGVRVPNSDMGSYKHFINFAKWSIRRHPAKNYMVILWNHGSGRVDIGGADNTGAELGIAYDDLTRNFIRNSQLAIALKEIKAIAGKKVDVYSSDACLMQMLSVAYEMKDHAEYIVQSEEIVPGYGFPYNTILTSLNASTSFSAAKASQIIVDRYNDFYKANTGRGTTISVIDSSGFGSFNTLLNLWIKQAVKHRADVLEALKGTLSFEYGYDGNDTSHNARSKDLYDFIENVNVRVDKKSELYKVGKDLQKHINGGLVVKNTNKITGPYSRAKGLAVYLPKMIYDTSYDEMFISRDTLWDDFVKWIMDESYKVK